MSNKQNLKARASSRSGPKPITRPRRLWESPIFWLAALTGVALAAALVVSLTGSEIGSTSTTSETAFAEIIGPALPDLSQPDTAVGLRIPDISAQTFAGDRLRISADDGTARLYGFFAHWCPHCQAELPRTTAWLETNDLPDGVEVVAVSTAVESTAGNFPPSEWFAREAWPAVVVVDDAAGSLASGFGLTGFPYWVAADSNGKVVARVSGELSIEQFEMLVDAVTPTA
jgi:thiol-disulfide isomerase/thioredoxin